MNLASRFRRLLMQNVCLRASSATSSVANSAHAAAFATRTYACYASSLEVLGVGGIFLQSFIPQTADKLLSGLGLPVEMRSRAELESFLCPRTIWLSLLKLLSGQSIRSTRTQRGGVLGRRKSSKGSERFLVVVRCLRGSRDLTKVTTY